MAGSHPPEGLGDDFFEQILAVQPTGYGGGGGGGGGGVGGGGGGGGEEGGGGEVVGSNIPLMGLQLGSSSGGGGGGLRNNNTINMGLMPLGLNLEHHGFLRHQEDAGSVFDNNSSSNNASSSSTASGINERDSVHMSTMFPAFGQLQNQSIRPAPPPPPGPPPTHQQFHSQPTPGAVSAVQHPPAIRPRVRARRGQATDPHSIAEREIEVLYMQLRRERIAERMKALQELVPTSNKTDRAAMLDEIVDYVKFLRLQVKVLSMSRLGAAGAVAQLVADLPLASVEWEYLQHLLNFVFNVIEGEGVQEGANPQAWEKWSNDGTEEQVAKLMERDIRDAMRFLQSKQLCIMPISLASVIFRAQPPDASSIVKPESNTTS